jgi:hypothetical protein
VDGAGGKEEERLAGRREEGEEEGNGKRGADVLPMREAVRGVPMYRATGTLALSLMLRGMLNWGKRRIRSKPLSRSAPLCRSLNARVLKTAALPSAQASLGDEFICSPHLLVVCHCIVSVMGFVVPSRSHLFIGVFPTRNLPHLRLDVVLEDKVHGRQDG